MIVNIAVLLFSYFYTDYKNKRWPLLFKRERERERERKKEREKNKEKKEKRKKDQK